MMNVSITLKNLFNEKIILKGAISFNDLHNDTLYLYDEENDFFIIKRKDIIKISFN